MAWIGYYVFDNIEIINASRTEAYAAHAGLGFFKAIYRNTALPLMLGETYTSPLQDDAPWTDPDFLESYDFYGAYPLDVSGIEDSTVSATVTESTLDGGNIGAPRRATKTIVFSVALIGQSECALDYGMRWFRVALNGGGCIKQQRRETNDCGGHPLEFLSCEPALDMTYAASVGTSDRLVVDGGTSTAPGPEPVNGGTPSTPGNTIVDGGDPDDLPTSSIVVAPVIDLTTCLPEYLRFFHRVTITTGPTITSKMVTSSGQSVWTVEFTAVAADPMEYGAEQPIIAGFMDPAVSVPYVGGVVPNGGFWDDDGYVTQDQPCPTEVYMPVFDPQCPLLIAPPAVPEIQSFVCFNFPTSYVRRTFTIPQQYVPSWGEIVPVFTIHTPTVDIRNLRVRFYPDTDNDASPDDLCDFEGSVLFTYLPANSAVIFDGVDHVIYVDTPGFGRRRADSIALGAEGRPLEWPEMSCGYGFVVTVDTEQTQAVPSIDLSLYAKVC